MLVGGLPKTMIFIHMGSFVGSLVELVVCEGNPILYASVIMATEAMCL